jgi:hypothetical protein
MVDYVLEHAEPWDVVLERVLNELPPLTVETILLGMEMPPKELGKFIDKCPEELCDRLTTCYNQQPITVGASNDIIVQEDHNGWSNQHTGAQICSAALRIDKLVYHTKEQRNFYVGRIICQTVEIPFCELTSVVDTGTFKWMRDIVLRNGAGLLTCSSVWENKLLSVALTLHPPVVIKGIEVIGWDDELTGFIFPTYLLTNKGEVQPHANTAHFKQQIPATNCSEPCTFTPEEMADLPTGPGSATFWASVAVVAANILAPVFGRKRVATALIGENAELTGHQTAKMLGCLRHTINGTEIKALTAKCTEHGWPVCFIEPPIYSESYNEWLTSPAAKNCLLSVDWYAARSLLTYNHWNVIESCEYIPVTDIKDVVRKIIPSFLQYMAQQGFQAPHNYRRTKDVPFTHLVLVLLGQWYASMGGDYMVVSNAIKTTKCADGDSRNEHIVNALMDLLCRFFTDGEIGIERAGFISSGKKIKALICFPGEGGSIGHIFIPKLLVARLLTKRHVPQLNNACVTEALVQSESGDDHIYGGLAGWLIKEDLWNKRLHRFAEGRRYRLDIAT